MNSNNKIYSFFIILALLFWNPISYFLIYANTPIYPIKAIHVLYWIVFIGGVLLIFLIQKNLFNEKIKNIIFTIALVSILFSAFVIVDRAIGLILKNKAEQVQKQEWLIFEPNSNAKYQTVEFNWEANINSLGLRDREINIDKEDKYRILCFGDSWTFGYGVNVENSWPKKLEQYLLTSGFENIEVINCGRPGLYTTKYKNYIEKYIPILKPDLVLVGVLQLDDLAQLFQNKFTVNQGFNNTEILKTFVRKSKSVMIRYLKYSFKNILSPSRTIDITSKWEKTSTSMISDFKRWQNLRFSTLNDSVQSLFKTGNLYPGWLDYYINFPDRVIIFNNPNHPATKYSIQKMTKDFEKMSNICYKYNSKLIFINIPMHYFTGHQVIGGPSDILNSYFEKNNNIDSIYRSISNANNLPYIELTNHFIGLHDKNKYLFKYDGHPNEKGYEEIAKYIGKQLIELDHLIIK